MITEDKVIKIFCIMDESCRNFASECDKNLLLADKVHHLRNRKGQLSYSEIMTILVCYHFGSFTNFKHYYLFYIKQHLAGYFPDAVSYNRFVELMSRVFFHMMLFMKLRGFGKCSGISFVGSMIIPVCHNLRRYANKGFKGVATNGKGTMGWCHRSKLHLLCNDNGVITTFFLLEQTLTTGTNECERSSPRNSTEKYSPTGDTSNRYFSRNSLTGKYILYTD